MSIEFPVSKSNKERLDPLVYDIVFKKRNLMNDLKENQKKKFPDFLHFWFIIGVVAIVPLLITLIDQDVGNFGNVFTIIIIQGNLAMIFFAIVSMVLLLTKKYLFSKLNIVQLVISLIIFLMFFVYYAVAIIVKLGR